MDTPRTKFVSNNKNKVRPKLPLYSTKKSEKISQSKSVTMDDILRSVKTLDDTSNVKKIERSESFSKSDRILKKFRPCSSLDDENIDITNPGMQDISAPREFSTWEPVTNDPKTPSSRNRDVNELQRSPILLSKVGKTWKTNRKSECASNEGDLFNSQSAVGFKSLGSQRPLKSSTSSEEKGNRNAVASEVAVESCTVSKDDIAEKVGSNLVPDSVSDYIDIQKVYGDREHKPRFVPEKGDQLKASESHSDPVQHNLVNPENVGASVERGQSSPVSYSQRSFENEANAALSVFDVSDFLTCPKTRTSRRNLLSQLGSAKNSSGFRVPSTPPVKFIDSKVGIAAPGDRGRINQDSLDVQPSLTEEEFSADGTTGTGFTPACGRTLCGVVESSNSASQPTGRVDTDDNAATSQFKNADSGVVSSNDAQYIKKCEHKNSLFTLASGKTLSVSSASLKKAALLFESSNKDSPETTIVGNNAHCSLKGNNINCSEPHTPASPKSLGVIPASSETSQDGSSNVLLSPDRGFSTASGKDVVVSRKSLSFASSLMESMESGSKPGESSCELTSAAMKTTNHQQYRKSLFNTANGKTMIVSSANLKKAKNLLDECSGFDIDVSPTDPSTNVVLPSAGVDKQVLNRNSLENIASTHNSKVLPPVSEDVCLMDSVTNTQGGEATKFSTAGRKNVFVAERSLNFASQLMGSLETAEVDIPLSQISKDKSGQYRKSMFQSASGKVTSISSANLQRAKNLLDSLDGSDGETNSSSETRKMISGNEMKNSCKFGESGGLLDNDDDLFQTIETPSKSVSPPAIRSLSSGGDVCKPQDNELMESRLAQNVETSFQAVSTAGDSNPRSSPTVFNQSGITTQMKNFVDGIETTVDASLLPNDIQAGPETKILAAEPRSPILLNRSFRSAPSPRRLQFQKQILSEGEGDPSATSGLLHVTPSSSELNRHPDLQSYHKSSTRNSMIDEFSHSSNEPQSRFMFFKSSSGKTIEPTAASLNKVRSLLSDLIDEEMDSQISSYVENNDISVIPKGKSASHSQNTFSAEGNMEIPDVIRATPLKTKRIGKSPQKLADWKLNDSEIKSTSLEPAFCKSIEVSDESLKRDDSLFRDVLGEAVDRNCDASFGEVKTIKNVSSDDLEKELSAEFCSPVLLDGSFVERRSVAYSKNEDNEINLLDCGRSRSPVLSCSFVAPPKCEPSTGNGSIKQVSSLLYSKTASLKEEALSSPDWGEFPDLKSSQAALLENQGEKFIHEVTPKEGIGLEANRRNNVEWGEFPEMPTVDVCKLEQTKNYRSDVRSNDVPADLKESILVESGPSRNQKATSKRFAITSSVTIERVPIQEQTESPQHPETSCKRKSSPSTLQSVCKKTRLSLSEPDKLAIKKRIRTQQCALIRPKRNQQIQPSPGKLFLIKKSGTRKQLKDLDDELKILEGNHVEVGVSKRVMDITSENSVDYRFCCSNATARTANFVEGDLIADSCLLAYADDDTAGLKEVTTALLTSPHVDPKLIPNGWITNHYRWIVWKLASLERTFPNQFGGSCLTLENVLLQLKYRYDREIDMTQRSSFKKMLEGDAAPTKFICCVAAVKKNNLDEGESLLELELTDGWYSIWAVIDSEMVELVKRDVVGIGTKLIVHGAELTNCEQGCDPLNVPTNVKLKVSTNSVRRVKWFAKMGFSSNNNPIPALLCSILPNGGLIGQVTAVVARKYPVIYMCKDRDGKTVFRNERSQALFREQQEKIKSDRADQVYEQVWKEVESKYRKTGKSSVKFTSNEIQNITDPELLFSIMDGPDAEFIQSQLSADQLRLVMQYKDEIMAKMKNDVQKILQDKLSESEAIPKVTKLLKVRLMDFFTEKHALLTIWRPSEDDLSVLREGKAFEFLNLIASGTRDKVLQLSNTRQTTYSPNEVLEPSEDCGRTVIPLSAFNSPGFTPTFGEIDVVGVVILVKLPEQSRGVTVVYLSDLGGHYLSITFWTSLSVFGCEDLITEGSLITCSNLQWRTVSNQRKIPSVFASEITSFSRNPKESHLKQGVTEMRTIFADKDIGDLVSKARSHIIQTTGFREGSSSPAASTPLRSSRDTPVQKKLKLLNRMAADAPPLSPIPLQVTTRHVFQNFKSPCRTPLGPSKSEIS